MTDWRRGSTARQSRTARLHYPALSWRYPEHLASNRSGQRSRARRPHLDRIVCDESDDDFRRFARASEAAARLILRRRCPDTPSLAVTNSA